MVSMARARPGRSLPELIVALALLGGTLAAVASAAVLGTRWTTEAIRLQRAVVLADHALDSLQRSPVAPRAGELDHPELGVVVGWEAAVHSAGDVLVSVRAAGDGRVLFELAGVWIPPIPVVVP
jgi:hypothetical protein